MPAKTSLVSAISRTLRTKKPLYFLAVIAIAGLAAWANSAWHTTASAQTESAITPALELAAGTLRLEGTEQAMDAASAAKLLPLWQLLAQLDSSDAAAPQEITAVLDEIRLGMTASQIQAISAMSFTGQELGSSSTGTAQASSAQANAASGAMPGGAGMFAGGGPMDGGGPMPGGGARNSSTSGSTVSTSASPSLIDQVIQLLEKKVNS